MAENERFIVAIDHPDHDKAVPSDALLDHVVKGRQKAVQQWDYSKVEEFNEVELNKHEETFKEIMGFK